MANIMQLFRAKNKVSRNAFDLSKKIAFTAQAGELLPVYSRILMQGDVFDISTKWKTRTAPLNTAAFTRFREYYDWFFVPLNLLWDKYNTWSTNMKENNQVATSINGTTLLTDKHPYFTVSQINSYLNSVDAQNNAFGLSRRKLSCKLLSYLGYGDFYNSARPNHIYNSELAPWRLLAYQKIYQDWFRNSQWESSRPESCNINYIDGSLESLQLPIADIDETKTNMFDLQYANWNKDMFMGVLPNSQYGDEASVNALSISDTSALNLLSNSTSPISLIPTASNQPSDGNPIVGDGIQYRGHAQPYYIGSSLADNTKMGFNLTTQQVAQLRGAIGLANVGNAYQPLQIESAFSILALRKAEALQKFREIQQSNSQDFPSQSEALFGHRPNNAYSQRCLRIGGFDGTIEIQDIDNTNITENSDGTMNSADIAGKGVARGDGNLKKFTADVPGVLMCIYHIVPLLDYASSGIDPDNVKTNFTDYAEPVFDKTGMVQVPLVYLTNQAPNTINSFDAGDGLLGYAPNYFDYKTDFDVIRGAFYNGGLESWVAPITRSYIDAFLENASSSATGTLRFNGLNYNFFKINPSVTNGIFATDVDSDVSSDKFWINCYNKIHAVRPLDVDGLPY